MLLRSGLPLPSALAGWHRVAPRSTRAALVVVARRLALGDSVGGALRALEPVLGADAPALAAVAAMHLRTGGAADEMVHALARSLRRRRARRGSAAAAAAGARLSGRVIAGLPLLFLPLAPLTKAPVVDAWGLGMMVAGVALALGGIVWIERLVPSPPAGVDGAALLADLLGAALRAGVTAPTALEVVSARPPEDVAEGLRRAARIARLGSRWSKALQRVGDARLAAIGETLERAEEVGVPVADALEGCAEALREEGARAFETELRRAPVLMVFPLTMLVLPSLLLLGVGPLLRGLGRAW